MKHLVKNIIPRVTAKIVKPVMWKSYPAFVEQANDIACEEVEGIVFDTPSELSQWRARTHLTKEPATIEWIKTFERGSVFWDIGANIGVYSLYAAKHCEMDVYSFEPSPFNFHTLSRNILRNGLSHKISAFCIALSDQTTLNKLHMTSTGSGAAHTGFQNDTNEFGDPLKIVYSQSTLGLSADDFIEHFKAPMPHYIKIDVDGAEGLVIQGALKTLQSSELRSILIELPTTVQKHKTDEIVQSIQSYGFNIASQDHPDGDERLTNFIFSRS